MSWIQYEQLFKTALEWQKSYVKGIQSLFLLNSYTAKLNFFIGTEHLHAKTITLCSEVFVRKWTVQKWLGILWKTPA